LSSKRARVLALAERCPRRPAGVTEAAGIIRRTRPLRDQCAADEIMRNDAGRAGRSARQAGRDSRLHSVRGYGTGACRCRCAVRNGPASPRTSIPCGNQQQGLSLH
jgi:hypothetical protein